MNLGPGQISPDAARVTADVALALAEDLGDGDITAELIPPGTRLATRVVCREPAVLAGRPWFEETFRQFEAGVHIDWLCQDGETLARDQEVCGLEGDARAILSGERTALNFIQTLSGTATSTRRFIDAVAGMGVRILDTRKTIPGLRLAQKYAVACGGGSNHRIGLFDAILIKENHIRAAGSIESAVRTAFARHADVLVEVEVEDLEELRQAVAAGARRALLDNFEMADLKRAVTAHGEQIELEASGNVSLETVAEIAATGVDYISTGAITKHVQAIDFSMRFV